MCGEKRRTIKVSNILDAMKKIYLPTLVSEELSRTLKLFTCVYETPQPFRCQCQLDPPPRPVLRLQWPLRPLPQG